MNWKMLGKFVTKVVTSASVGVVIDNAIKHTTPIDASPINKVAAQIGGFIISSMVGDKAAQYVENELSVVFGQEDKPEEQTPEQG